MLARLWSATVVGVEARLVQVEVNVSFGLPSFSVVGLPDSTVRESRDRVRSAIENSGFEFPTRRITINLAPADVRKRGSWFDLPIAVGVLAAAGLIGERDYTQLLVLGELSLDGTVQPVRGVLPMAVAAQRRQMKLLVPTGSAQEAAAIPGLSIHVVATLAETVDVLNGNVRARRPTPVAGSIAGSPPTADLADVTGQHTARRALEVAAAGHHNLLFVGPPGGGKTLMARRLPGILPPLDFEEAIETTTIHSVVGLLPPHAGLLQARPFRAPHHNVSDAALLGGGPEPRPGEVSLAHNGVLFLDELPEFSRRALEALRQPLEEGEVRIARASGLATFPARFMLVGAMNPCACGHHGDPMRVCRCTPTQLDRYHQRLSGPLRDRFDMTTAVSALSPTALTAQTPGEPTETVRGRVIAARERQAERFRELSLRTNAELTHGLLRAFCRLDTEGRQLLERAAGRLALSARACDRIRRVARTIADLEGAAMVTPMHLAEALEFRGLAMP